MTSSFAVRQDSWRGCLPGVGSRPGRRAVIRDASLRLFNAMPSPDVNRLDGDISRVSTPWSSLLLVAVGYCCREIGRWETRHERPSTLRMA
jgi:hypothetical protein